MTTPTPPSATGRGRRFFAGCGMVVLVLLALVTILGLIGYSLYRAAPAGYTDVQRRRTDSSPAQRLAVAESLENRISSEITFASYIDEHGRPLPDTSDTRFILLTNDEINAWLDQRLLQWLDNQDVRLPVTISDVSFWTRDDLVMLGARVRAGDFDHVVSFTVRISVPTDGSDATVRLDAVRLGRLPVPLGVIRDALGDSSAARALDGFTFPTLQNIGGQRARWLSIQPTDGGILIELKREDPAAR